MPSTLPLPVTVKGPLCGGLSSLSSSWAQQRDELVKERIAATALPSSSPQCLLSGPLGSIQLIKDLVVERGEEVLKRRPESQSLAALPRANGIIHISENRGFSSSLTRVFYRPVLRL